MVLAFGLIKLSITFYYRRIFVVGRGFLFDWITKAAIIIAVLWTVGCVFGFIFSCGTHVSANWGNDLDVGMYCGPSSDVNNAFVVSDLVTDVMVLCMPLPVVSTRDTAFFTVDTNAKVIDLEPSNDDGKETGSYGYFSHWRCVNGLSRNFKLTTLTDRSLAPSSLQL